MLKKILAYVGVNVPLHITYVTDIAFIKISYKTSTSNITHPPTYERLHKHLLPEKEGKNRLVPYKKYLISLIKILNPNSQLGRPKLVQIFSFWSEEDVISLYNQFKLERKTVSGKRSNLVKKCSKLKEYRERHTLVLL